MMEKSIVVGMGEALWDILPEGKKLGGAPANFAYHTSQFGCESYVVSAVGHDELGDEIYRMLSDKGLRYFKTQVDKPTGTVQVTLDDKGVPQYEIKENVAWDYIPFTPELKKMAQNTRVVCFGSLAQRCAVSRNTINCFVDEMSSGEGIYKIFDINLRQHFYNEAVLRNSMNKCNVLKINDEELEIVAQLFGYNETEQIVQCQRLLDDFGLKMLILTCGVKGSYVFSKTEQSFIETPLVEVADTVGAGDSFTAAFISAILCNKPLVVAHKFAVEVSAYVCTQHGAMPALPTRFTEQLK